VPPRFSIDGRPAAIREIALITNSGGPACEDVGVERNDDVSLVEVIDGVRGVAGSLPRASTGAVAIDAIPLVPLGLRERLLNQPDLIGDRG